MKYETRNYLLEIEGYRKYLDGLIEYTRRFQELADYGNYFFFGDGYAEGIELLVQKKSGAFNGWISYTFANVNYDFGALAPEPYPASHDKTHEAKLVGIYKWGPLEFRHNSSLRNRYALYHSRKPILLATSGWR